MRELQSKITSIKKASEAELFLLHGRCSLSTCCKTGTMRGPVEDAPPLTVGTAGCVVEWQESGRKLQRGYVSALLGETQGALNPTRDMSSVRRARAWGGWPTGNIVSSELGCFRTVSVDQRRAREGFQAWKKQHVQNFRARSEHGCCRTKKPFMERWKEAREWGVASGALEDTAGVLPCRVL